MSKDKLYMFDPILYQYKNPNDDIINSSIHKCYTTYINLKKHIAYEPFNTISIDYLPKYKNFIIKPYTDNTKMNKIRYLHYEMK